MHTLSMYNFDNIFGGFHHTHHPKFKDSLVAPTRELQIWLERREFVSQNRHNGVGVHIKEIDHETCLC